MIELHASRYVAAQAVAVYDLITDIGRMGEWSPENQGGEWLDGASGPAAGARFTGRNRRRAAWTTTATVTEADPGRAFTFVIGKVDRPETRWQYTFTPTGDGCQVSETCEILREPGLIGRFLTRLGTGVAWSKRADDLQHGMDETLRRLAATAEPQR
ncbi:MAG: hypothetical protein QOJ19_4691 [Acidimicrobiia bacterium]|jgi:hypothetical protein|nr:hypothetical protein [Acidimicrobiia bacterium]